MKKRILFLAAWYPTRYDSMGGLFVSRHAEILTESFDVAVLHTYAIDSLAQKLEVDVKNENNVFTIRVYYPKVKTSIPGLNQVLKFWYFFKAHLIGFKEVKKQMRLPDLVHVNVLTRVGIFALYLKLRYSIPYVILEHWSRYLPERGEYKGWLRKTATRIVVHYSSAISTVSEKLKMAMINCGISHQNFFIIHNVVDTNLFQAKEPAALNVRKLTFSNISCFDDKAKNVTGIIRVVHELSKKRNDFLCLLVGDGPDKTEAKQLAEQLGINGNTIKFTGLLEGTELVEIFNQSLFTVLFSNYENMPVVISESFACGKPVIATSVGGIPEIVNETTGILVLPKDEEKLSNAIEFMLDHYIDYDPIHIRNYAIDQFGKASVLNQLQQLYQPIFEN